MRKQLSGHGKNGCPFALCLFCELTGNGGYGFSCVFVVQFVPTVIGEVVKVERPLWGQVLAGEDTMCEEPVALGHSTEEAVGRPFFFDAVFGHLRDWNESFCTSS